MSHFFRDNLSIFHEGTMMNENIVSNDVDLSGVGVRFPQGKAGGDIEQGVASCYCMVGDCIDGCNTGTCDFWCDRPCMNWPGPLWGG